MPVFQAGSNPAYRTSSFFVPTDKNRTVTFVSSGKSRLTAPPSAASPNETVVHGRPSGRRLADGDLLSIDCGAIVDGWHGDGAVTVHIGAPTDGDERLRAATEAALAAGIAAAVPGATMRDVAVAIDSVARRYGYQHVLDHGGHGIGRQMHEGPFIANVPTEEAGWFTLRPGNTVALEPMLVTGAGRYKHKRDGWAVVTVDGSRAAHAEHTVLVTESGGQPLTVL